MTTETALDRDADGFGWWSTIVVLLAALSIAAILLLGEKAWRTMGDDPANGTDGGTALRDEVYRKLDADRVCGDAALTIKRTAGIAEQPWTDEPDVIEVEYACGSATSLRTAIWSPGWTAPPKTDAGPDLAQWRQWRKHINDPTPEPQALPATTDPPATVAPTTAPTTAVASPTAKPTQHPTSPPEDQMIDATPPAQAPDEAPIETPEPAWTMGTSVPPTPEPLWTPQDESQPR